jgi:two-component system cell cycle sensor histidine kinase/response regulator CckA|tara:strand:+ start:45414 stop:47906 length:2493 start_codon:yes stop_codon:yes gene_type:complete
MTSNIAPVRADQMPDPTEWPRVPTVQRNMWTTIAIAVIAALGSAALVGYALGIWEFAALFAALVVASGAIGYFAALGRSRRGGGRIDWALVRAALESQQVALAITDREGRLVSANAAYGARANGFPAPTELALREGVGDAAVLAAANAARRDGSGFADISVTGDDGISRRLRITVRPAEQGRDYLLWTLRRDRTDKALDDTREMIEGPLGGWFGSAGILAAMAGGDGRVLASNHAFMQYIGEQPAGTSLNLGNLVDVDDEGDHWLICRSGTGDPDRLPVLVTRLPLTAEAARVAEGAPTIAEGEDDVEPDAGAFLFLLRERETPQVAAAAIPTDLPALMGVLPIGLALTDRDGQLKYMNDAFRAAAGVTEDMNRGLLYPSDLVGKDDKSAVADMVRRAASSSEGVRDLRVRLKHRPDEPVVLTIGRAPWQEGPAVVLSLKDNREQMRLERQITQATKMQAVGQLAGGVAHDFNNILTAIIGYCDLMMMRHSPGDPDFDDINQVRQNANRAANLVRQLLAFSRQQTLRPQLLQVSDIVGELSHLLKRLLGERVKLTVDHGRGLAPVRADPGQMEQVIVNLAVNSRDAMPDGGTLTIRTFAVTPQEAKRLAREGMPPADYVAIAVCDTGTGIPAEALPKIFEPFFTTKEVGRGTGLGLSTVYGIVKQSGGFIFADSREGDGTDFTIYLPAQEALVEPASAAASVKPRDTNFGEGTILIAEDEDMVRAVAERALTRKGYDVVCASDGEAALEMLMAMDAPPDLLITDVVMPVMDGPALVAAAREKFPQLKIVFMSGYAEEQLRSSLEIEDAGFLAKPFSVNDITEKVYQTLKG